MSTITKLPIVSNVAAAPADDAAPATRAATAAQPALEKQPISGWQEVAARVKDGALTLASKPIAVVSVPNVRLGNALANLHFHGNLTEQIALKHSDPLVQSNPDRAASKGITWTKVGMVADAGAVLGVLGFDEGVKVSAVVPTESKLGVKSLLQLLVDQGKLITLDFHPDAIAKYPAGTEFHIAKHKTFSAGAVARGETNLMQLHVGGEIGAEATWDKSAYAKTVTVMPDKQLGVRLDKQSRIGASVGAGAHIGHGIVDGDRRPNVGDYRNEPNNANIVSVHVGSGASRTTSISLGGNFAAATDPGKAGYDYVMKANPDKLGTNPKAAKQALEKYGMTVAYSETTVERGSDLSASVLKTNLITKRSHSRNTDGTLYQVVPGSEGKVIDETRLSEKEYAKTSTGKLLSWAKHEERDSLIRMGEIQVNGGPAERAALLSLTMRDQKTSAAETQEATNLAAGLGFKTDQRPAGAGGKSELKLQIGLTHPMVQKLDGFTREQFRDAINTSMGTIAGHPLPWNDDSLGKKSTAYWNEKFKDPITVKARWAEAQNDLANRDTNGMSEMKIKQQYESSTGRDYYRDMATFHSVEAISDAFEKAKGKPLDDRTHFLKTLSKLSAPDLRSVLLAMRTTAGAGIVQYDYTGNGVTIHADPETKAPATVAQIVDKAFKQVTDIER